MPDDKFVTSALWRRSLAAHENDADALDRERLRNAFTSFRIKAGSLAGEISKQFPDYTVHDITHLDALWDIGSIIAGDGLVLNAAEGFVLGGAFLVHDLGMGAAANAAGISKLHDTEAYKDIVALLLRQRGEGDFTKATAQEVFEAEKLLLRETHAKEAESLPTRLWTAANGEPYYLIDNEELRNFFGPLIGKVAYSHWWPYARVRDELSETVGSLASLPAGWTVDLAKVAALLRAADAAHLDSRRAPLFLGAVRNLSGESARHWKFQGRMARPTLDRERLRYSASPPFDVSDADAWWLAFDTCRMVDSELRAIDDHFSNAGKAQFAAKGVLGSDNSGDFADYVAAEGWFPIDARPNIRDVPGLIERLGGVALYGGQRQGVVVLRELLQNAVDASFAFRALVPTTGVARPCQIKVEYVHTDMSLLLRISDYGVGMSESTVAESLLNFGSSLWSSAAVRREFPGLLSSKFKAVGHFGIGFFASFMLASKVTVRTRHFKKGPTETLVIEFRDGLKQRPIVRKALESEFLWDPGTVVELHDITTGLESFALPGRTALAARRLGIQALLTELCAFALPFVDVQVVVSDGTTSSILAPFEPSKAQPAEIIARGRGPSTRRNRRGFRARDELLRDVKEDDGTIVGRLGLNVGYEDEYLSSGAIISSTGVRVGTLRGAYGYLYGDALRAARDAARGVASTKALEAWASEQVALIDGMSDLSIEQRLQAAEQLVSLGAQPAGLPIARTSVGPLSLSDLTTWAESLEHILVVDDDYFNPRLEVNYLPNVVFAQFGYSVLGNELVYGTGVPADPQGDILPSSLEFVEQAVLEAWDVDWDDANRISLNSKYDWAKEFHANIAESIVSGAPYREAVFEVYTRSGRHPADLEIREGDFS